MDDFINQYLEKVDQYLKPLAASERVDIVKEIKSQIVELQTSGKTAEEITARLGTPKDFAKAYLGESITKSAAFSWRKLCSMAAYYSLAGTVWMFLLPLSSIMSITFVICGLITPAAGLIKFVAFLFGYDIPQIQFSIGSFSANAFTLLPISLLMGAAFFVMGKLLWTGAIRIIKMLSRTKSKIQS